METLGALGFGLALVLGSSGGAGVVGRRADEDGWAGAVGLDGGDGVLELDGLFLASDGVDGVAEDVFAHFAVEFAAVLGNFDELGVVLEFVEEDYAAAFGEVEAGGNFGGAGFFFG